MAQWMGQYSGLTHATKVQDIEESLRQAVRSLAVAPMADGGREARVVNRLCQRLLAARLKLLCARISDLTVLADQSVLSMQLAGLKLEERRLQSQGVDGILKEFGAHTRD